MLAEQLEKMWGKEKNRDFFDKTSRKSVKKVGYKKKSGVVFKKCPSKKFKEKKLIKKPYKLFLIYF